MNKNECKKYIKRAFNRLKDQNKSVTPINLEIEMQREIKTESDLYIAYSKMALYTLLNSATDITAKHLTNEIDVMPRLYSKYEVIIKANNLPQIFSQIEKS